jgi:hypothetical protein
MPVPRNRDDHAYFLPLHDLRISPETELFLGLVHDSDGTEGARRRPSGSSGGPTRSPSGTIEQDSTNPDGLFPKKRAMHWAIKVRHPGLIPTVLLRRWGARAQRSRPILVDNQAGMLPLPLM